MIIFPHAKINLGLWVTGKRPDGYHAIETLFLPVEWCDLLEWVPALPGQADRLTVTGEDTGVPPRQNLVFRALESFRRLTPLPGLHLHLHKHIPPGSGLGGGSSDAAHLLLSLQEAFGTPGTRARLEELALELGSDCPFFLQGDGCLARGRGEQLEPVNLDLDLEHYEILVVVPRERVSTAWAYSRIRPAARQGSLAELARQPVEQWTGLISNDFEELIFPAFPGIRALHEQLVREGAVYASLSGSGSAVYGIFRQGQLPPSEIFGEATTWSGSIKKPG